MSGITGIFRRDGQNVDPADIKKMNDKIAHRGHDGSKIWCEGSVAFGHQMLYTTPESLHEELPFEDEDSGLVITADARIDNRKELAPKLGIENNEFISDSYFILKSYGKWGEKCPEKLLGDFSFVIWDKNKKKLFCSRDHMGVKPFYYYISETGFFFATEMKALFSIREVPYELNEIKLAFHLMEVSTDRKLTFYKNIFSLSAAHSFTIGQNHNNMNKYWELDPDYQLKLESEEEYVEAFNDIFAEAIKCRLRSVFPIGFELSGGLDSSSVVSMTKKIFNDEYHQIPEIHTYSMVFDEFPQVDERYYIKKVTDSEGVIPHFIHSDGVSPLENISNIFWHQEQPFYTPNIPILSNMYKKMSDNNTRIILGGLGGDQTISRGWFYLRELAFNMQWKKFIIEINCLRKHSDVHISSFLIQHFIHLTMTFVNNILKKMTNHGSGKKRYNDYAFNVMNKKFIRKLGGEDYLNSLNPSVKSKSFRKNHYYVLSSVSNQSNMELIDKMVSSFNMESRYPFFDKRLVEFCFALPDEMKFRWGWNRYIQRIAMEDILPKEIQWRIDKKFFNQVLERNLMLFEKSRLNEIFDNDNPITKDYLDLGVLKDFYQKYDSGNGSVINNNLVWFITILDLWLKQTKILHKDS